MRTSFRLCAATLVVGLLGISPALAQKGEQPKPKNEAELKALEDQLQKLVKELKEQEAKKPAAQPARPAVPPVPQVADTTAALQRLLKNPDPKIAAMAAELLERLAKATPPAPRFEVVIGGKSAEPAETKNTPRVVATAVWERAPGANPAPAPAASSLKMSADGKTAAVVGADGGVVVYDVASGRELMRFPGKK